MVQGVVQTKGGAMLSLVPGAIDLIQIAMMRGLGRAGFAVDGAWSAAAPARFQSKYCRTVHSLTSSDADLSQFGQDLVALCQQHAFDVVLPSRPSTVAGMLEVADRLKPHTNFLLPTPAQFQAGMDKLVTYELCRELGIPQPNTLSFNPDGIDLAQVTEMGWPLVIKHPRNFGGSYGVRCVENAADLSATLAQLGQLEKQTGRMLAQAYVPGPLYDACLVANQGKIGGLVTQCRRVMYPISGGVAAVLVSVNDAKLTKHVYEVVEALQWTGPLQIEFKFDPRTQQYQLIEFNPRFWGTTGAWLKAGVNLPAIAARMALGESVVAAPPLPAGLRVKYVVARRQLSALQYWHRYGQMYLRDPQRYTKTWWDFDFTDPWPDLWRVKEELKRVSSGERLLTDNALAGQNLRPW